MLNWIQFNRVIPEEEIDISKIYLWGHSRGASEAILFAAENEEITKLASWAAFSDFMKIWKRYYDIDEWKQAGTIWRENPYSSEPLPLDFQIVENYLQNKQRFNILNAMQSYKKPVMLIHGTEDDMVPMEHALELKQANKNAILNLFPGASHTFGGYHPFTQSQLPPDTKRMVDDLIDFFNA